MDYLPLEFRSEPRRPRYGPFLVLGLLDTSFGHFAPFLAIFEPFLGHIVEVGGKKRLCSTRK